MAKRNPAAAISQNQNGREMIEEPDFAPLEELELEPEELELPVPVAVEEPGEVVVREGAVLVSVIVVIEEEERGIMEFGGTLNVEEARVRVGAEDISGTVTEEKPSLIELGLEGVPAVLDDESAELGLETDADADGDEPEVAVAVAANAIALDAAALAVALVDVTFKLKLDAVNVTLLVACHVSDPN